MAPHSPDPVLPGGRELRTAVAVHSSSAGPHCPTVSASGCAVPRISPVPLAVLVTTSVHEVVAGHWTSTSQNAENASASGVVEHDALAGAASARGAASALAPTQSVAAIAAIAALLIDGTEIACPLRTMPPIVDTSVPAAS